MKPERPVKLANSFPLLLLFAVPHEAAAFRASMKQTERFLLRNVEVVSGKIGARRILTACTGMGRSAVEKNFPEILDHLDPCPVLMCGYAGALDPSLQHADVVRSASASTLFHADGTVQHSSRVVNCASVDKVAATPEQKAKVREKHGAEICDMEYAAVERLANSRGFPCGFVRAISDVADTVLPASALDAAFDMRIQAPTPLVLIQHFLKKPAEIMPFLRFVSGLNLVREKLTASLLEMITTEPASGSTA